MKLTRRQRFLWARAIISAAWAGADTLPITDFFIAGWKVVRALFTTVKNEVPEDLAERRMAVCRECEVYRPDIETCGPAFTTDGEVLGCRCFMPAVTRLKNSHCWLRENTNLEGVGWPDELLPPQ